MSIPILGQPKPEPGPIDLYDSDLASLTRGAEAFARRFWLMVDTSSVDGCWEWNGKRDSRGYGVLYTVGTAHRVAFELSSGQSADGCVLHSCDNPPCCRPSHLRLGTRADNVADMMARGRHVTAGTKTPWRGPSARITVAQAAEIRSSYAAGGVTQRALGARHGITQTMVSRIILGKAWL